MIYNADRAAYGAVKEALFDYLSEPEEMIHVLSAVITSLVADMAEQKLIRDLEENYGRKLSADEVLAEMANR